VLDHVGVPVSDFERSKRFYAQALSPLGYELLMEPSASAAGFGRRGKPDFWIGKARQAKPSTSHSLPRTASPLTPSTKKPWRRAGVTTVVPGFVPTTTRATTGHSSSIRTATTSKRSAISQQKKPETSSSYSPRLVVGKFSIRFSATVGRSRRSR
jgi:catechol 2,3-dioxygenase-like lactoylglutathione lyase family enzyme